MSAPKVSLRAIAIEQALPPLVILPFQLVEVHEATAHVDGAGDAPTDVAAAQTSEDARQAVAVLLEQLFDAE